MANFKVNQREVIGPDGKTITLTEIKTSKSYKPIDLTLSTEDGNQISGTLWGDEFNNQYIVGNGGMVTKIKPKPESLDVTLAKFFTGDKNLGKATYFQMDEKNKKVIEAIRTPENWTVIPGEYKSKGTVEPGKTNAEIEKAVKETKFRLPKEYLDMTVAMRQGENKNFDYNTYKPTAEGTGNYGASITAALLKGLGTGLMSGVNKAVTADIGKMNAKKMAKDLEELYGVKFTEETPESKAKSQEMNKNVSELKDYLEMNKKFSKPITGTTMQNVGSDVQRQIELKKQGDELRNKYGNRPFEDTLKMQEQDIAGYKPEDKYTGGVPIELRDQVDALTTIYKEYGKKVKDDDMNRQNWLRQQLQSLQPAGWEQIFSNVVATMETKK